MKTIGVRNISMYINMGMYNGRLVLPLQSEWTSKTCKQTATSDTSLKRSPEVHIYCRGYPRQIFS